MFNFKHFLARLLLAASLAAAMAQAGAGPIRFTYPETHLESV